MRRLPKIQPNFVKITKFQKTENEVIKIIFLDVDGCLSDGGLYHSNGGEEMKKFNVKDGFGIQEWQRLGLKVAIITGKSSQIVANRARELKIDTLFQGEKDKLSRAEQILKNFNLSFDEAAAIGDDIKRREAFKCGRDQLQARRCAKLAKSGRRTKQKRRLRRGARDDRNARR